MISRCRENVAVQPWSQSCPIERRPVVVISGKRCWVHASGGSDGMSRLLMWVDVMVPPLGSLTVMGDVVGAPAHVLPS